MISTNPKYVPACAVSLQIIECLKAYTGDDACDFDHHYDVVKSYVDFGKPIRAILPSFPGKPINPDLAPSHLPDGAEEYAIGTLKKMIAEIQAIYPPGLHINLFHDGYYFIHLAMDYDCAKVQEYVNGIKAMCKDSNIYSIDINDVTQGNTYEARIGYWNCLYAPAEHEVTLYNEKNPGFAAGMTVFFFNNYSKYLYPDNSNNFRRRISKYIARHYVATNMSVQKFIDEHYTGYLRLSVKKQCNPCAKKMYINILKGIDNSGLPWMNTLCEENGRKIVKRYRDPAKEVPAHAYIG